MSRILAFPRQEPERRNSGRVESSGIAVIQGSFAARILELAIGGVSLLVDDAAGLPGVGEYVRLDVRLDRLGRWLPLSGSVVRVDACESGSAFVVELFVVPPEFEDLVQDELLSALEREQPLALLIPEIPEPRGRV